MRQMLLSDTILPQARPFIKWVGGKQALCEKLVSLFPTKFNTYYEPFLGGGSVYFRLQPEQAILGDYNAWLLDTYKAISNDWEQVAVILNTLVNTKDEFLRIRAIDYKTLELNERAAHFIYLNKTCFRGMFRVNMKGGFNVPYGEYDRPYYNSDNLDIAARHLKKVTFREGDFEMTVDGAKANDFVYFDPPYFKLGGHSDFNRYTDRQFNENDQIRLAALCRELDSKGVKWALSNSNTPFIKALYSDFTLHEIDARREINLNSKKRDIKELLVTNYSLPES
jgi:DNA adenine methylase